MPVLAIAGASIGGSLIGGLFGNAAADTQANAAEQAAQLQYQEQQQALGLQQQEFATTQAEQMPWIQSGQSALATLKSLLAPGGELTQQFGPFTAPSAQQAEENPGYQFALQQGQQALEASAAARGDVLTGGMGEALTNYGQRAAQQDYQQVYNNALNTYQQNFNTFNTHQSNLYNRYASMAGLGQQAAGTAGQLGMEGANAMGNVLLGGGAQIGQDIQQAAYQRGSGYAAFGNALGGGLSNLSSLLAMRNLLQQNSNAGAAAGADGTAW